MRDPDREEVLALDDGVAPLDPDVLQVTALDLILLGVAVPNTGLALCLQAKGGGPRRMVLGAEPAPFLEAKANGIINTFAEFVQIHHSSIACQL